MSTDAAYQGGEAKCPYCQQPLNANTASVVCSVCGTAHHKACWDNNRGCTRFGCAVPGTAPVADSSAAYVQPDSPASGIYDIDGYPPKDAHATITISVSEAVRALGRCLFCVSADTSRPVLTGVMLCREQDGILCVATDTHRMSVVQMPSSSVQGRFEKAIIPYLAVSQVISSTANEDGTLRLAVCDKRAVFLTSRGSLIRADLIAGDYPDFRRALPLSWKTMIRVKTDEFAAAINYLTQFATPNRPLLVMRLDQAQMRFATADSPSQFVQAIGTEVIHGRCDPLTIGVSAYYLKNAIDSMDSDYICVGANGPTAQILFQPAGEASYKHVLMPMAVPR